MNNFTDATKPIAIDLPAGRARKFKEVMEKLIDELQSALPAVFQSEDYQTRRGDLDEAFQAKQAEAFSALREKAAAKGVLILRTPSGFAMVPEKLFQPVFQRLAGAQAGGGPGHHRSLGKGLGADSAVGEAAAIIRCSTHPHL